MALTITIPGAVETTTGSTAPAVLTVGVGAPGVGVPSGGTSGQVLQKLSGVSYDTGWLTLPADFITSVTSPLAVAAGVLSVDLSAYLTSATAASTYQTLAGMSSYLTTATAASTYYLQTNPSGFQTAANVTTALSPYLLSATAASTYAVIAAGQPTAGTTGQVLTKNSGTNYDSSWATLIPGDRYLTSSTTSLTIDNANKTLTVGTGLSYTPTQNITISYDASNHMHGEVLTYNSGTGVLTVDVNHHTGSGTYASWVVNVGGVTPATSVAWGAITGTLSSQTDLQAALDLKANLASPTFSGSPSLPTGSIGVTQSPGNNTTALATTAFVTAAVPAFATTEQAALNTSATTLISPANYRVASLTTNAWAPTVSLLSTATLGTGANAGSTITALSGLLRGPSALTVGYASRGFNLIFPSNSVNAGYNFGTTSGHSIKVYGPLASTVTGVKIRAVFGRMNSALPAPAPLAARGYGWEWNMATKVMSIIAHDGTTLTTTAVTWVPLATRAYELTTTSDGAGTISLYVDGTLLGTSSGGPTTTSTAGQVWWQTEIQNEATAASQQEFLFHNPKVYTTNG